MSSNTKSDSKTHNIEANDDLVRSVIVDQTDNIEKGWREAFQNIIDSEATVGELDFTSEWTFVRDNGDGIELTEQKGVSLLTVMGESTKDADDHDSIGEFGIGKGQIIAKGLGAFISGDQVLFFDIKNWGLTAEQVPLPDAADYIEDHNEDMAELLREKIGHSSYDGLAILVDHYEDEVPDEGSYKWNKFEDDIQNRFQYLNSVDETELFLNGDLITDKDPKDVRAYGNPTHTGTTVFPHSGLVHFGVRHGSGSLTIYSGGIKVTTIDSRGLQGQIVTENNLRLNFARNEIKSGCPIMEQIEDRLDVIRRNLFKDTNVELEKNARSFIADQMFNHDEVEEYSDEPVFETSGETMVSWNEITEKDEIGTASKGNPAADKLEEAYGEIVLNEQDGAVEKFLANRDNIEDAPDDFDAQKRAEDKGLHTSYEESDESELRPTQKKKLGVARYITSMLDDSLVVKWGESDVAKAWTDGTSQIVITESAAPESSWIEWVPSLWQTMVHEHSHNGASKNVASHGVSFNRRFRNNVEVDGGIEGLQKVLSEINDDTLKEVAERGHAQELGSEDKDFPQ